MEEYGRAATEEVYRQWAKGINPAVYLGYFYYDPQKKTNEKSNKQK